jgi:uncharacterized protein (DUF4415 family)
MKKYSKTDLDRIDATKDEDIDTAEIPSLGESFLQRANIRMPGKKRSVTIRLDEDVIEWFKKRGRGYQSAINAVLAEYVRAMKKTKTG